MKSINKLLFSVFIGVIATIYVFTITSPVKASSGAVCVRTNPRIQITNDEGVPVYNNYMWTGDTEWADIVLPENHGYILSFWYEVVEDSYCENHESGYDYMPVGTNQLCYHWDIGKIIKSNDPHRSYEYVGDYPFVTDDWGTEGKQMDPYIGNGFNGTPIVIDLSCYLDSKAKFEINITSFSCGVSAYDRAFVWLSFVNYGYDVAPDPVDPRINEALDFNLHEYCGASVSPTPIPTVNPTSTPAPTNTPTPTPTVVYTPRPTSTSTPTPTQESMIEDENIVYVEEEQGDLTIKNLNGSEITSVVDFAVENSFGEISFNTNIDFSKDEDKLNELNKYISISQGKVEVDTDSLVGLKDVPATITLKGLSFKFTPIILVDGHEDTDHIVSNIRYNPDTGVLVFDVKHFTIFEAVASPKEQESTTVTPVMTNTQDENQAGQQAVDSSVSDVKAKYSRIMIVLAIIAVILMIAVIVKELRAKNSSDE